MKDLLPEADDGSERGNAGAQDSGEDQLGGGEEVPGSVQPSYDAGRARAEAASDDSDDLN